MKLGISISSRSIPTESQVPINTVTVHVGTGTNFSGFATNQDLTHLFDLSLARIDLWMKKNKLRNERRTALSSKVSNRHPLIGTWEEEPNIGGTTTVVFEVSIKDGGFVVTAWDSEDGTELKISQVKWDGSELRFTSFYPPGEHTTANLMRYSSKGKLRLRCSGTYADGEKFSLLEVWVRSKKQRPKPKPFLR